MIRLYPFGHEVIADGKVLSMVTDKVVIMNPPENTPVVNDLKKYIETGKVTRELKKLFEIKPGLLITYHSNGALMKRTEIKRKIEHWNREFYLVSPLDDTYELFNSPRGQKILYTPTDKTLMVFEKDFMLYIYTEAPVNYYGRKIIDSLFTDKLKKTLEPMFPFRKKMIITVEPHKIIAYPEDRAYKIVVEDNDFIVYNGNKPVFKYIYRCGKRITKYGFDPERVPCMKKL